MKNFNIEGNWMQDYKDYECDADAMSEARKEMYEKRAYMVAIYKHEDNDTCGRVKHIVSYYNEKEI